MELFPGQFYENAADYFGVYAGLLGSALASVDRVQLQRAASCLDKALHSGGTIYSCGNGGSAAIANHLVCDCVKGVQTDTALKPKVHSLTANVEILTAISNDISYEQVFSYQLASFAKREDVLVAISSSGKSSNILRALHWARANGLHTIAMTGFDGGEAANVAEISLHVDAR